jgi:hypothetical protein
MGDAGEPGLVGPADGPGLDPAEHSQLWRGQEPGDDLWGERGRHVGELPPHRPLL